MGTPGLRKRVALMTEADSFFVRLGHVGAAGVVFVGLTLLRLGPREFAVANALFVLVWLLLAWRIGRAYRDLSVSGRLATSAS
jgi:hypothetical protein